MFSISPCQNESSDLIGSNHGSFRNFFTELASKRCGLGVDVRAGQTVFNLPNCGHNDDLWSLGYEEQE